MSVKRDSYHFHCIKCDFNYYAEADKYEAPPCPKCKDSEYVTKITLPDLEEYDNNNYR